MMYTKDEVETILEFVNDDMRRSVEKELANANHVTALLMRMLMAQVTPPPPPTPPLSLTPVLSVAVVCGEALRAL
jgi:hypothetical protein